MFYKILICNRLVLIILINILDKKKELSKFSKIPRHKVNICFSPERANPGDNKNILSLYWDTSSFDSLNLSYFKEKPIYIDYSFFVLVDKNRHVRGYYDARYVSEIKRLTEEYQHLRLKEEKDQMLKTNKIESK